MSTRRHWSVEDDYDSYSYSRPARYSNVSSNVYVTPQRYVTSVSDSYSPVGKTYTRSIPAVAHQRLTTTAYPPRTYVPTHYDEERILGYRSPPSSHHISTTTYRPVGTEVTQTKTTYTVSSDDPVPRRSRETRTRTYY